MAPYNGVNVFYDSVDGKNRVAKVGSEPFFEEELTDPQPNENLATKVVNNLLPQVTGPNYEGRLRVIAARDQGGSTNHHRMLSGDQIRVGDWGPAQAQVLPVTDVEWDASGASVGINMVASAARTLALAEIQRARRKWRCRRRNAEVS